MACTDPQCVRRAAQLRAIADEVLMPLSGMTRIPAPIIQGFVEGTTTGAVAAAKAPKGRKVSAYAKAYGRAYKRIAKKNMTAKGVLRKGWNHKKIVKAAHKATRTGRK